MNETTAVHSSPRLLIVDDDQANLDLIQEVLDGEPLEVSSTTDSAEALLLVRTQRPDIVLLDLMMPGINGLEMLDKILEIDPGIDVMLITGNYSTESAVEAVKKGAFDYLTKPLDIARLRERVRFLYSAARQRQQIGELDRALLETFQFENIVGRSPQMLDLFRKINRMAQHFRTILLLGETGTGKELVARALHRLSPVSSGPFVACNCSALAESLFETELFGAVKGAYTGAFQDRKGIFEYADGGTLMLDEIGDMPLNTQAKLLRVLQNQEFQRVGSPVIHKANARVVAATNRDLRAMVAAERFREDLYYRLSMLEIRIPPLDERKEDLPLLLRHFVQRFSTQCGKPVRGLTRRAQSLLSRYPWPGNIRELENVIGHACIMTQTDVIDVGDLPESLRATSEVISTSNGKEPVLPLEEVQRRYARTVVENFRNKARAADLLGISRNRLYRLLSANPSEPLKQPRKALTRG